MSNIEEYFLSDEEVPEELLLETQRLSQQSYFHKVYFDKDTGNIFAISNEDNSNYEHFFEISTLDIESILGNKPVDQFKVCFDSGLNPSIILKSQEDLQSTFLERVDLVENWDQEITVEQYPVLKKWGIHLRDDKRTSFRKSGVTSNLEFFIVYKDNRNLIVRSFEINLSSLYNERVYIPFVSPKEETLDIEVYTKKFFKTAGYKVLYDTED